MIFFRKQAKIDQLTAELSAARVALAAADAKVSLLAPEVEALREDKKKLLDRVFAVSGFMPMYERPAPPTPEELVPIQPVSNIRDYCKGQTILEAKAFADERKKEAQAIVNSKEAAS